MVRMFFRTLALLIVALGVSPSASGVNDWQVLLVDAGEYAGTEGLPIFNTGGQFYQHPDGGNFAPLAPMIASTPDLAWDSYVALGGKPSSASTTGRLPHMVIGGSHTTGFFAPFQGAINNGNFTPYLRGLWFQLPTVPGVPAFASVGPNGHDAVFIARLTVPRGDRITGSRVWVGVRTEHPRRTTGLHMVVDGSYTVDDDFAPPALSGFQLVSHLAAQPTIAGFGDADVYDLYVERDAAAAPPVPPAASIERPVQPPARIVRGPQRSPRRRAGSPVFLTDPTGFFNRLSPYIGIAGSGGDVDEGKRGAKRKGKKGRRKAGKGKKHRGKKAKRGGKRHGKKAKRGTGKSTKKARKKKQRRKKRARDRRR